MSVEGLQSWVIETGLMVSLLILIVLIIRRPFARIFGVNATYALWSLPLIRLCLPVLSVPDKWVPEFFKDSAKPQIHQPDQSLIPTLPQIVTTSDGTVAPVLSVNTGPSIAAAMLVIWLSVAALWLSYQLLQQRQFKARLMRESATPSGRVSQGVEIAARQVGLNKSPIVRVSKRNIGPFITGVINPIVILPATFETNFDATQRHFALLHELAHLKRKDLWVAFVALVFRAVNWPNPLVHYAAHRLRADQEAACDAFVMRMTGEESVHSYAETLVKAAKQTSVNVAAKGHLALALADTETEISKGD